MPSSIFLKANIWTASGTSVADVQLLIGDTRTNRLTHLVIRRGLFDFRLHLVEMEQIAYITDGGRKVHLDMIEAELDELPKFYEVENREIVKTNLPEYSFVIREGAGVDEPEGQFSRIKKVNFDPAINNKIISVTLEQGRIFPTEYDIPIESLNQATDDWLRRVLNGSSDTGLFENPE
jgi:hypothetical protein